MSKKWMLMGLALYLFSINPNLMAEQKPGEASKEISGVVQNANASSFIVQSEKERIEFTQMSPQVKIGDRVTVSYSLTPAKVKINSSSSEAGTVPKFKDMIIDDRAIYHANQAPKAPKKAD